MDREFLDLYNRELALLREYAVEFAEEYPGVAERLGGLVGERADPMIAGLLEGAAFLAARVQLKLRHEFPEFTQGLLEQLAPTYLAPTPSAILARVEPPYAEPDLREGRRMERGAYFDATYRERGRNVSCRFRLASPLTLWPLELAAAEYHAAPGPLQALGIPVPSESVAGLRLSFTYRTMAAVEDEPPPDPKENGKTQLAGLRLRDLPIHLLGAEADTIALYEQIFAHQAGVYVRYLDAFGDPVVFRAPEGIIEQIGFDPDDALIGADQRVFRGFDFLRDLFVLPQKFLGFRLTRLNELFARVQARAVEIVILFDEANPRLPSVVQRGLFQLYAAPAVNLFEKTLDRVQVRPNQHEYHVVPDRSRVLEYEPNRIIEAYVHLAGEPLKVPVYPLHTADGDAGGRAGFTYAIRRLPRRRTAEERKFGHASDYVGTDIFISLGEPPGETAGRVSEISLRALCTNRHLPEHLPVGTGGADFQFLDDASLPIHCIAGPTPPREPVALSGRGRIEDLASGPAAWRLINMLSLNHLGLVQRGAGKGGQSLREMLALFADMSDSATERKIRGIRSIDTRAVVRRMRQATGTGAARGLEVTVLLDEKAFEGSGPFLLGAVLDRFFAGYVALNHFTQTVIRTTERGEIMRWPPRAGSRELL